MQKNLFVKLVRFVVFCLIGIFYLVFLVGSLYEAVVFPQTPQKVTLAHAVNLDLHNQPAFLVFDETLYVSITDAIWECASVKQTGYQGLSDRRYTDAVFTDAQKTAVVWVQVNGFYSCEDLKAKEISGELQRNKQRPIKYQSDSTGTTLIDADSEVLTYYFCTHCTPSAAVGVTIVGLLAPFVIKAIFERWKAA